MIVISWSSDERGMIGGVVMNAMQTYVETGKKTYVICHCGAPTKKQNFSIKRKKMTLNTGVLFMQQWV